MLDSGAIMLTFELQGRAFETADVRAYGRNLVGITSLSATFIGTCSDRRLALAIAAEPLSLDALQGERRVARSTPEHPVAVCRFGAAP